MTTEQEKLINMIYKMFSKKYSEYITLQDIQDIAEINEIYNYNFLMAKSYEFIDTNFTTASKIKDSDIEKDFKDLLQRAKYYMGLYNDEINKKKEETGFLFFNYTNTHIN